MRRRNGSGLDPALRKHPSNGGGAERRRRVKLRYHRCNLLASWQRDRHRTLGFRKKEKPGEALGMRCCLNWP